MAKRKTHARRPAPRTVPQRVNPFTAADGFEVPARPRAPAPRGVQPASFGRSVRPTNQDVDPVEAALYGQVAPGMRGGRATTRMPEAATAANSRMTADASRISSQARAEAYREEFLSPEEEGDAIERMGIDEFEQEQRQEEPFEPEPQQMFETQRVLGRDPAPPRRQVPPPPAERPAARVASHAQPVLALAKIADGHVDNLWDWIREDGDRGATFLGQEFDHSVDLYRFVDRLNAAEAEGLAIARAITFGNRHLGFLMLTPILTNDRTAILHCYLSPGDIRNRGGELLSFFVGVATKLLPGFKLAIPSPDQEWAKFHQKVLGPLGFAPHTMFVR